MSTRFSALAPIVGNSSRGRSLRSFSLLNALFPHVIYKDLPHLLCSKTKKVSTISPGHLSAVQQAQEHFVYQNRGWPGVRVALTSKIGSCSTTEFEVNKRSKPMKCLFTTRTPLLQQPCDLPACRTHTAPLSNHGFTTT